MRGLSGALPERKGKRVCSGTCLAALSRRRRGQAQQARDQEILALLEAALREQGWLP